MPQRVLFMPRQAAVVIGGDLRAIFYLYGYLERAAPTRARGIHTGAIAAVLWACKVPLNVAAAAAVLNLSLVDYLHTVLPADAHDQCTNSIVLAASQRGWTRRGKLCKFGRWASKEQLISNVVDAVTPHPLLNIRHGYCSASGAVDTHAVCANAIIVEARARPPRAVWQICSTPEQCAQWHADGRAAAQ